MLDYSFATMIPTAAVAVTAVLFLYVVATSMLRH